jgi:nicotinate-nucleotide--dimethylbenzimidazole phosphoribosyltransferase
VTGAVDVAALAALVGEPDPAAYEATRAAPRAVALGRLGELAAWVAARQGLSPPADFARAHLVAFAETGPDAAAPQLPEAALVLAGQAGVSTGIVALDTHDAGAALAAGVAAADAEVDAGADLLVAGDLPGAALGTAAAAVIAALADVEPVQVIGRGTGLGDQDWTNELVAVRDALRRGRRLAGDPVALLAAMGTPALAALTGFLAQAAVRRTPVILDGAVSAAAALTARELAPRAVTWWLAGHRSPEPAQRLVLERLRLPPVLDLDMRLGAGTGALLAVPILRAAVHTIRT